MKIIPASDSSLLVVAGETISAEAQERVFRLFRALHAQQNVRLRNLHPGYGSLLVDFDPLTTTPDEIAALVASLPCDALPETPEDSPVVTLPVCYDEEFGPDLVHVAGHTKLPVEEVIRLHCGADYRVAFLGFTAGFAYLSGMPEALNTPRLATPRSAVAEGSVGIAGTQTGIYPAETPGGWQLIGRTPLRMFDPRQTQPTRVLPGDRVRFASIDRDGFERLWRERA